MKNRMMMPLISLVAVLASCDVHDYPKNFLPPSGKEQSAVVSITVTTPNDTKVSGISPSVEEYVNGLQVFIFGEDGALDAYQAFQGSPIEIRTTSGPKKLYVVANAPSLSDTQTEQALRSHTSFLSDNTVGHFVMSSGAVSVNLIPGDNSIPVVLDRIASRIEISRITNAMSSAQHQETEFKVLAVYLTNVSSSTSYDLSAGPLDYYNKMAYQSSEVDGLVYDNCSGGQQVEWNDSINNPHYLYAYPNPSTDTETNSGVWSPRCTKLVVKASLGGVVYYYPVALPAPMLSNKTYKIEEFKITRPGSLDQDTPVSFADCSVTVSVNDWYETSLGDIES